MKINFYFETGRIEIYQTELKKSDDPYYKIIIPNANDIKNTSIRQIKRKIIEGKR